MSRYHIERLKDHFPSDVEEIYTTPQGDDFAVVRPEAIADVCRYAKTSTHMDFKLLLSICGVDRLLLPESTPRFEVIYSLRSLNRGDKIHLKARLPAEHPVLRSVVDVWRAADWWERHTWDMYGIRFEGHPDLKRLYLYEEFEGHPLRKDYPLLGRQPLVPERDVHVVARGPGAAKPNP